MSGKDMITFIETARGQFCVYKSKHQGGRKHIDDVGCFTWCINTLWCLAHAGHIVGFESERLQDARRELQLIPDTSKKYCVPDEVGAMFGAIAKRHVEEEFFAAMKKWLRYGKSKAELQAMIRRKNEDWNEYEENLMTQAVGSDSEA